MNLPQAIVEARIREEAYEAVLTEKHAYKIARYFHDCLPGCIKNSPRRRDHVPLPGNTTPTCRVLYYKSLQWFAAGQEFNERLFLAANRIGKTETAAYEVRCHLTGDYPEWWPSTARRFAGPTEWWAAGDTRQTTRDIIQTSLMGPHTVVETSAWCGMIDPHLIVDVVRASGGVAHCLDTVTVQHVERHHGAPCTSEIGFRSFDQGRRTFQGTSKHGVWLDEEPPDASVEAEAQAQGSSDIWTECLLRTMTTEGMVIATFTPLRGYTPFLKQYVETAFMPGTEGQYVDAKSNFYADLLADKEAA
jgi:phage terminase large subunit-like protein